jgi:hypothetical protein
MVYQIGGSTPATVKIGGSTGTKSTTAVKSTATSVSNTLSALKTTVPTSKTAIPSISKSSVSTVGVSSKANAPTKITAIPSVTYDDAKIASLASSQKTVTGVVGNAISSGKSVPTKITTVPAIVYDDATIASLAASPKTVTGVVGTATAKKIVVPAVIKTTKSVDASIAKEALNIPDELSQKLIVQSSDLVKEVSTKRYLQAEVDAINKKNAEEDNTNALEVSPSKVSIPGSGTIDTTVTSIENVGKTENTKAIDVSKNVGSGSESNSGSSSSKMDPAYPGYTYAAVADLIASGNKYINGVFVKPKTSTSTSASKSTSALLDKVLNPYGLSIFTPQTSTHLAKNAVAASKTVFGNENPLDYQYIPTVGYVKSTYDKTGSINLVDKAGKNIKIEPNAIYTVTVGGKIQSPATGNELLYNTNINKIDSVNTVKKETYIVSPGVFSEFSMETLAGIGVPVKDRLLASGMIAITGMDKTGESGKPRLVDVDPIDKNNIASSLINHITDATPIWDSKLLGIGLNTVGDVFNSLSLKLRKTFNSNNIPEDVLTYGTLEATGNGSKLLDQMVSALKNGKLPSAAILSDSDMTSGKSGANLNRAEKLGFLLTYAKSSDIKAIADTNPKAIAEMSQDLGIRWKLESMLGEKTVDTIRTTYENDKTVTSSKLSYIDNEVKYLANEFFLSSVEGAPLPVSAALIIPGTLSKGAAKVTAKVAGKEVALNTVKSIKIGDNIVYRVSDESGKVVGEFKQGETVNNVKITDAASAYKAAPKDVSKITKLPWETVVKKTDATTIKADTSAAKVADNVVTTDKSGVKNIMAEAKTPTTMKNLMTSFELKATKLSDGVYKVEDVTGTAVKASGKTAFEAMDNVKAGKYTELTETAAKAVDGTVTTAVDDIPADFTHQPTGVGADSGSGNYGGGYSGGTTSTTPTATGPVSTIVDDTQRGTKAMQVNGEWYILDKETGNYMTVAEYDKLHYGGSTTPTDTTPVTEIPTEFNKDRGVYVRQLTDGTIQAYDNAAGSWITLADYDAAQAAKATKAAQDAADAKALADAKTAQAAQDIANANAVAAQDIANANAVAAQNIANADAVAAANARAVAAAQYTDSTSYTPAASSYTPATTSASTADDIIETLPSNLNDASVTDLAAISDQINIADPSTLKLTADKEAVIWNSNAQNAIEELKNTADIKALTNDELKSVESALAYHEGWGKYDATSTALFKSVYEKFSAATKKIYGTAVTAIQKLKALLPSFTSGSDDTATAMLNLVGNTPMGRMLTYTAQTRVMFKTSTLSATEALASLARNSDFYKGLTTNEKALFNKGFKNLLTEETGKSGESLNTLSAKEISNWNTLYGKMPTDEVKKYVDQAQVILQKDADELKPSTTGYTEITPEPSVVPDNAQITELVTESSSKEPNIDLADLDNSGMVSMYSREELPAMYAKRGESLAEKMRQTKTYQSLDDTGKGILDAALEHQSEPTRIYFLTSESGVSDLWKSIKSDATKYPDAYDAEKLYHEAASSLSLGSSNGVGRGPNFELALDKVISGDADEARALIKSFNDPTINADRIDFLASRASAKVEQLTVDQIVSLGLDDDKASALLKWKQTHASKTLSNLYGTPNSVKTALFDEQAGTLTTSKKLTALSDAHVVGGRISKLADDALDMDIDALMNTKGVPEIHTEKGYNYIKQQFESSGKSTVIDTLPGYEAKAGSFNENGQLLNGYVVKGSNGKYITSTASDALLAIKEVRSKFIDAGQHQLDPFDINMETVVNKLDSNTIMQLDGLDTASLVRNPKLYNRMMSIASDDMKATFTTMRDAALKVQEEKLIQFDTIIEELRNEIRAIDEEFAGMRKAGCA